MNAGYDFVAAVAAITAVAAILDFRTRKIPNWLTVPAAVLGLAYHALGFGPVGPVSALLGLTIGFSLLILPWLLGGGGMGDVKLLAALGAWLGPVLILASFGLATVLAAFAAIIIVSVTALTEGFSATKRRYATAAAGRPMAVEGCPPRKVRRALPFAVPIAASTWIVLAWMVLSQA
jgi:prepilin peptidase CpaA